MTVSRQASLLSVKSMIMMLAVALCNAGLPPVAAMAQSADSPYPGRATVIQLPRSSDSLTHPPAASDLLRRMRQSLIRTGSAHIESSFRFVIPHSAQTIETYHTDYSWHDSRLHATYIERSASVEPGQAQRDASAGEIVIAGGHQASRSGYDAWKCDGSAGTLSSLRVLLVGFLDGQPSDAHTIGPTTIDGVPVWHVQATVHIPFLSKQPVPKTIDLYIGQSDGAVIRQTMTTITLGLPVMHITIDNRYTRYGKAVSQGLPSACRV